MVKRVLTMFLLTAVLLFATSAVAFAENGPIWPPVLKAYSSKVIK